jgi:D-alanyl-D-alanine carboxypeptidase
MRDDDVMRPFIRLAGSILSALALLTAAMPVGTSAADDATADLQARLETFVGLVPGGATALTVHDGITTTAATGILDDQGGRVDPETPFLVGPLGLPMSTVVVLQLVDDGRVDLEGRVKSYLPAAPVPDEATVRELLDWRAGLTDNYGQIVDLTLSDPSHGWTREELVDLIDPSDVGIAGDYSPSIGNEIVAELLVEAVEGIDFGTVLRTRISEPLGLMSTYDLEGDEPLPSGLAIGWAHGAGLAGDPDDELAGMRTIDGRTSSVVDLARFLQALAGGRLLSPELTAVVFDEEAQLYGMGFDTHEVALGDPDDLGTRYYSMVGSLISGYSGALTVAPESGDIVVVLTSNDALPAFEFVEGIVNDWAAGDA